MKYSVVSADRSPWVAWGALLLGATLGSCGQELPECPPGTSFEDCQASMATGSAQPAPMAGAGGGSSAQAGTGGSAGGSPPVASAGSSSSEQPPVGEGDDLDPPDPPDPPGGADPDPPQPTGDACPDDPSKTLAGVCGCGVPDDDFDGDGAMDCVEDCPDNAAKTAPSGPCGCSNLADTAACTTLRGALRNLYTFDGTGVTITDSLGGMNGTLLDDDGLTPAADLQNLQLNGRVNLDGFGAFVDLPDGLISSLDNATFEVWLVWRGGAFWSRIFDFGNNAGGGQGQTYLFLTPSNSVTTTLRVAYSLAGGGAAETLVDGTAALPIVGGNAGGTLEHVAVVVDGAQGTLRLYSNGSELGAVPLANELAAINDVNNWLGRSNFTVDPPLFGSLVEFRIYDQALSATQLRTSFQAGPGALN